MTIKTDAPAGVPSAELDSKTRDAITAGVQAGIKAEQERRDGIADIGRKLGLSDDLVVEHVRNETPLDRFRTLAIDEAAKMDRASPQTDASNPFASNPHIIRGGIGRDLKPGEMAARMLRCVAFSKRSGISPLEIAGRMWGDDKLQRALAAGIGASGGYTVPEIYYDEMIEFLRPASVVRKMDPTIIPMPGGNMSISRLAAGANGGYIGENKPLIAQDLGFSMVKLSAKKAGALVAISNDLLRFSSPKADEVVRQDLISALATTEDVAWIRGAGTQFTPKGMRNWAPAANIIAANGTISLANTIQDANKLVNALTSANSRMLKPSWLMAWRTRNYLYNLVTTTGAFVYRDEMNQGKWNGYAGSVDKTSAVTDQVNTFFTRSQGYNAFVLAYANLCKDAGGVDAFIIGSELRGLTQARSDATTYPAVAALKSLAASVKAILGSGCKIGYAADWSEWNNHQTGDAAGAVLFNLDPLWSDSNIDFIGIDNYMPLADWRDGIMVNTSSISETKVLWDRPADKLYVWDEDSKAWELFFVAANCVTNDQLTTALALKFDKAGGTVSGNLTVSGRLALGGAAIDPNNVLVLQGANSLFTNPSGSFGFVFSKAATANDASLTFQTNYSTRALVGLLGNDDLTFKVTPDGVTWYTGFTVDRNTGKVDHTRGAKFEALTNFDNYIASNTWTKVQFNSTNHNDQSAFNASSNRFVAPIAGYYTIGFRLRFKANSTVPASLQGKFYKNGSALAYAAAESSGTVVTMKTSVAYQTTMKLAANDYVSASAWEPLADYCRTALG